MTSLTTHAESWQIILYLVATLGWSANQIDVKMAFLNRILPEEETIYMEQPREFEAKDKERWVCKLQRRLYGMKQARRIWNKTLNNHMQQWRFT